MINSTRPRVSSFMSIHSDVFHDRKRRLVTAHNYDNGSVSDDSGGNMAARSYGKLLAWYGFGIK